MNPTSDAVVPSITVKAPGVAGSLIGSDFPRGDGPLVSVLIPTRQRIRLLKGCLESLANTTSIPSRIEVLLKIDDDDRQTLDHLQQVVSPLPFTVKALVSPRGRGYADLHLWYEALARQAAGDWLYIFNDDAVILTLGWDDALFHCLGGYPDGVYCFFTKTVSRPGSEEFFFLRRKVFEILGHLAFNTHLDTWIITVLALLQRVMECPVRVDHFSEYMNDEVAQGRKDATTGAAMDVLCSLDTVRGKLADAQKLLEYMENYAAEQAKINKAETEG